MKKFNNKKSELLTLLIQGPLHRNTIKNILLNQDIGKIVVSSWLHHSTLNILQELISLQNNMNSLKLLMLTPPPEEYSLKDNTQNIYLQSSSVYNGLNFIETKYTIKCRSDEYYTGLSIMVELLEANEKIKVISSNALVRKVSYATFHLSDHLFISNTNLLRQTYSQLLDCCSWPSENKICIPTRPAEVKLWLNFFTMFGYSAEALISMPPNLAFDVMSSFAELIDVANFSPYQITATAIGSTRYLPSIWETDIVTHAARTIADLKG